MGRDGALILIAEDDPNDAELIWMALKKANIKRPIQIVGDGAAVIAYLKGEHPFDDQERYPFPCFLLLDINLPILNGFEVLDWLGSHPEFSVVPTIMMSASQQRADIEKAYRLGINAYMTKPSKFEELVEYIKALESFWRLCQLPDPPPNRR